MQFNNFIGVNTIEYRHILNSGGILNYSNQDNGNYVRVGIIMYGICGESWVEGFKPVVTFKSKILFIKTLIEDTDISYGRACHLKKGEVIATVAAGYADGFKRGALNKMTVKILGRDCTVVGKVCMDMLMVNISDIDCTEGDNVIVFGESPTVSYIAKKLNTIPYEVLTSISQRVKRVFYR